LRMAGAKPVTAFRMGQRPRHWRPQQTFGEHEKAFQDSAASMNGR
jgi:hypothetical protein